MKKTLFAIALAVVATACHNEEEKGVQLFGKIAIEATTRNEVSDNEASGAKFNLQNWGVVPSVKDLKVEISGNGTTHTWESLDAFDAENNIPNGDASDKRLLFPATQHTIALSYGEKGVQGWSKPYFEGSTTVEVPGYELLANAQVEVILANAIVEIATTDNFNGYFKQSSFSINGIEWSAENIENHELLFMNPGEATITCNATRQTGSITEIQQIVELKPTTRHTILFDLSTAGNAIVKIAFDGEIVEEVELDVELNDKA